jgi:hypothetical protein
VLSTTLEVFKLHQGCQMVCLKKSNLGKFWRVLQWKMLLPIFYGHLVSYKTVWYILWPFGICCGHLVYFPRFTKKNIAALNYIHRCIGTNSKTSFSTSLFRCAECGGMNRGKKLVLTSVRSGLPDIIKTFMIGSTHLTHAGNEEINFGTVYSCYDSSLSPATSRSKALDSYL